MIKTFGFIVLTLAPMIVAAQYVPLSDIPGITNPDVVNSPDLRTFWNALYRICIGAAVVLAIVQIIRAGLSYMTTDSPIKIGDAKNLIWQSIIGLVLVLSPVLVLSIINPQILSLELGTSEATVSVGPSSYTGATNNKGPAETSTLGNGVVRSLTGTLFQVATFSSANPTENNKSAQEWIRECTDKGGIGGSFGFDAGSTCTSESVVAGQSGKVCTAATPAKAMCGTFSSGTFTFVDVVGTFSTLTLRALPSSKSAVDTFVNTCSANGGKAYVPIFAGKDKTKNAATQLDVCPENVENLPSGATGNCWEAFLACMDKLPATDTGKNGGGVRGYVEGVKY